MSSSGSEQRSQEQVEVREAQPWRSQEAESVQDAKSVQESGQTTDDKNDVRGYKALAIMNAAKSTAAGGAAAAGTTVPVAGERVSHVTKSKYISLAEEVYEAAEEVNNCLAEHTETRAKLDQAKERLAGLKRTLDEAMYDVAFRI